MTSSSTSPPGCSPWTWLRSLWQGEPDDDLPPQARLLQDQTVDHRVSPGELRPGLAKVDVTFSGSRAPHSITLTNQSSEAVRVIRYGEYRRHGSMFRLHNASGRFFDEETFRERFQTRLSGWIEPGEGVTDRRGAQDTASLWAFEIETRSGATFWTGAQPD